MSVQHYNLNYISHQKHASQKPLTSLKAVTIQKCKQINRLTMSGVVKSSGVNLVNGFFYEIKRSLLCKFKNCKLDVKSSSMSSLTLILHLEDPRELFLGHGVMSS